MDKTIIEMQEELKINLLNAQIDQYIKFFINIIQDSMKEIIKLHEIDKQKIYQDFYYFYVYPEENNGDKYIISNSTRKIDPTKDLIINSNEKIWGEKIKITLYKGSPTATHKDVLFYLEKYVESLILNCKQSIKSIFERNILVINQYIGHSFSLMNVNEERVFIPLLNKSIWNQYSIKSLEFITKNFKKAQLIKIDVVKEKKVIQYELDYYYNTEYLLKDLKVKILKDILDEVITKTHKLLDEDKTLTMRKKIKSNIRYQIENKPIEFDIKDNDYYSEIEYYLNVSIFETKNNFLKYVHCLEKIYTFSNRIKNEFMKFIHTNNRFKENVELKYKYIGLIDTFLKDVKWSNVDEYIPYRVFCIFKEYNHQEIAKALYNQFEKVEEYLDICKLPTKQLFDIEVLKNGWVHFLFNIEEYHNENTTSVKIYYRYKPIKTEAERYEELFNESFSNFTIFLVDNKRLSDDEIKTMIKNALKK